MALIVLEGEAPMDYTAPATVASSFVLTANAYNKGITDATINFNLRNPDNIIRHLRTVIVEPDTGVQIIQENDQIYLPVGYAVEMKATTASDTIDGYMVVHEDEVNPRQSAG